MSANYRIDDVSRKDAEAKCKEGTVAYDEKTIEEGDEEWIETVSVEIERNRT